MAANPELVIRIAAKIDEFKKNIAEGKVQIEALGSSVERMQKSFDGSKLRTQANTIVAAIGSIENAAKLSTSEAKRYTAQLDAAIEKHKRLGVEAPKEWAAMAEATRKASVSVAEVAETTAKASQGMSVAIGAAIGTLAGNVLTRGLSMVTAEMGRMWDASQKLDGVSLSFRTLASGMNQNADAMVDAVQRGTRGLVENVDIMAASNKAMLLGLPVTTESMGEMAAAATKLGRAMGQDATKSLDDLITALGRSSPLILDNLGLTVKVGDANEAYAKKLGKTVAALTEAEQKTAFYNAAMEAARKKSDELGDTSLTLTEHLKAQWVSVSNAMESAFSWMNRKIGEAWTRDINDPRTPLGFLNTWRKNADLGKLPTAPSPQRDRGAAAPAISFDAAAITAVMQRQADAQQAAAKAAKEIAALHDKLYGQDAIAQAKAYMAALGSITEISKLDLTAQKDASAHLDAALGAYRRLGLEAPQAMTAMADALRTFVQDAAWSDLMGKLKRLEALPGLKAGAVLQYDTLPTLGKPAIKGGLPMAFTGKTLTAPESGFSKAFGMSPQDFSVAMGQTVVRAFEGGGSPGKAVGSLIGSTLGESASEKLKSDGVQKALSGSMNKMLSGAVGMALPAVGALIGPLVTKLSSVVSAGVEKLFGNATKGAREDIAKKLGFANLGALTADLSRMGEQGAFLADFGANRIGRNDKAGNEAWMRNVQDFYANTKRVLDTYGLSLDDINGKHKTLADTIGADYDRLKKLGFGDDKLSKSMAAGLNDAVRAALTSGEAIPRNLKPVLESLIRSGGLSDDLARKLLGIAEPVRRDWRKMQEAAERYGLSVEQLGNGFKAAQLDELVEQLRADWELLAIPGADTNAILAAMAPSAQRLVDASRKWGYEIPANMRPLMERMQALGLLVDDNGVALESLDGLNFGVDLTKKIDDLIAKLGELIDKLTGPDGVADALNEALSAAVPGVPSAGGTGQPSVPDPNNTDPYLPDGRINPYGPYGYQEPAWGGAQAAGGDYLVTRPTMFLAGEAGPEQVSFSGANRAFGTAATVIVEIDGRTLAQTLIPVLPGELKRLRLA